MKKNKMMRAASGLMVATLLTTSIISGTFAKYTTEDSGSDTARVAKWGVNVLVSGSLFGQHYNGKTESNLVNESVDEISANLKNYVDSSDNENIVAPGTKNTKGLTLAVKGQPEVKNKISVETKADDASKNQEIYLNAGTYGVMVEATNNVTTDNVSNYYVFKDGNYVKASSYGSGQAVTYYELHDEVTLMDRYYPIKWTVTKKGTTGTLETNNYSKVEELYNELSGGVASENNANTKIDTEYTITWEWPFMGNGANDSADTILGNLMSKDDTATYKVVKKMENPLETYTDIAEDDYNLQVGFNMTIKVEQVD